MNDMNFIQLFFSFLEEIKSEQSEMVPAKLFVVAVVAARYGTGCFQPEGTEDFPKCLVPVAEMADMVPY